jgi:hypothetical protein
MPSDVVADLSESKSLGNFNIEEFMKSEKAIETIVTQEKSLI